MIAAVVRRVIAESVLGLENRIRDQLKTFVPAWRDDTIRARRSLARCWETAGPDLSTMPAR